MIPIINDVNDIVRSVESNGSEIVRLEYDIVTIDSKISYRKLTSSWSYNIGLLGDYRSVDMDIEVYKQNSQGTYDLVVSDNSVSSYAVVTVNPNEEAWYKFVVKCYKFKPGYNACHYCLIIAHK